MKRKAKPGANRCSSWRRHLARTGILNKEQNRKKGTISRKPGGCAYELLRCTSGANAAFGGNCLRRTRPRALQSEGFCGCSQRTATASPPQEPGEAAPRGRHRAAAAPPPPATAAARRPRVSLHSRGPPHSGPRPRATRRRVGRSVGPGPGAAAQPLPALCRARPASAPSPDRWGRARRRLRLRPAAPSSPGGPRPAARWGSPPPWCWSRWWRIC